ncbi:hypothetical protein FSC17_03275 [Acinetobacter indicus]|nr:hypothetical protein FSC17_03275 [Acinetobacter indicus]
MRGVQAQVNNYLFSKRIIPIPLIDAVGDDQVEAGETPCGGPGIEYGTYQLQNGKLFVNAIAIDTNGCAGLSDTNAHLGLSGTIGTNTLTFTVSGEGTFTLSRLN